LPSYGWRQTIACLPGDVVDRDARRTPEGRHTSIIAARAEGMQRARAADEGQPAGLGVHLAGERGSRRLSEGRLETRQQNEDDRTVFMTTEGPERPMSVGIPTTAAVEGSDTFRDS
jgi:hypothetical protein